MDDRPGCLGGLIRLFALNWIFDFLQDNFGYGRGGCVGFGCGSLLLVVFVFMLCGIIFGTNWFDFGF